MDLERFVTGWAGRRVRQRILRCSALWSLPHRACRKRGGRRGGLGVKGAEGRYPAVVQAAGRVNSKEDSASKMGG
jgi:hypothetical protein